MTQDERLRQVAGVKFLGQRYVLDAFLLNQLTHPASEMMPSAQSPLGAGCDDDARLQGGHRPRAEGAKGTPMANYDSQVAKLKGTTEEQLAKRSTFTSSGCTPSRRSFCPLPASRRLPCASPAVQELNTCLASWTELSTTPSSTPSNQGGDGGGEEFQSPSLCPPGPKGYVEPNPPSSSN